jgi:flagellar basal-body rod protein FlgC
MDFLKSMDISSSGMTAQRSRLNVISMNLANANTTRTDDGTSYRRKTVIFKTEPVENSFESQLQDSMDKKVYGVKATEVVPVSGELKKVYDPTHPDADKDGYVSYPNVNLVEEMVSMLNSNRSYEANATAIKTSKEMALQAIEIGR